MKLAELLEIAAEQPELIEEFLVALNSGFWDEWDCDLLTGVTIHGFGPPEIGLAAQAAPREVNVVSAEGRDGSGEAEEGNEYKIGVRFVAKNAGPHKDNTRADVREVLKIEVGRVVHDLHKDRLPWILEAEVG